MFNIIKDLYRVKKRKFFDEADKLATDLFFMFEKLGINT